MGYRKSIKKLKREGWRPEEVSLQLVPVLRDCSQFHEAELERQAALRAIGAANDGKAELEALLLVCWAHATQLDLVARLMNLVADESAPLSESCQRFVAWSEYWRGVMVPEAEHRIAQGKALEATLDRATVEAVDARVAKRIDAFIERTVPESARRR